MDYYQAISEDLMDLGNPNPRFWKWENGGKPWFYSILFPNQTFERIVLHSPILFGEDCDSPRDHVPRVRERLFSARLSRNYRYWRPTVDTALDRGKSLLLFPYIESNFLKKKNKEIEIRVFWMRVSLMEPAKIQRALPPRTFLPCFE